MIVNDERVAALCGMTPTAALELFDKGRSGDPQALADWSIYAVHRALRVAGAAPAAAIHHTLQIARGIEIQVAIKS